MSPEPYRVQPPEGWTSWSWECYCEPVRYVGYMSYAKAKTDADRHRCDLRPAAFRPLRLLAFCAVSVTIAAGAVVLGWAVWFSM